jgi:hypothetical protein
VLARVYAAGRIVPALRPELLEVRSIGAQHLRPGQLFLPQRQSKPSGMRALRLGLLLLQFGGHFNLSELPPGFFPGPRRTVPDLP